MAVRLLLALMVAVMLALFAAPGAACPATCHDGSTHRAAARHGPAPTATGHACIGCILPADWRGTRIAGPRAVPEPSPIASIATLPIGRAPPPVLQPPRIG